jgi:hypothetical protein
LLVGVSCESTLKDGSSLRLIGDIDGGTSGFRCECVDILGEVICVAGGGGSDLELSVICVHIEQV